MFKVSRRSGEVRRVFANLRRGVPAVVRRSIAPAWHRSGAAVQRGGPARNGGPAKVRRVFANLRRGVPAVVRRGGPAKYDVGGGLTRRSGEVVWQDTAVRRSTTCLCESPARCSGGGPAWHSSSAAVQRGGPARHGGPVSFDQFWPALLPGSHTKSTVASSCQPNNFYICHSSQLTVDFSQFTAHSSFFEIHS